FTVAARQGAEHAKLYAALIFCIGGRAFVAVRIRIVEATHVMAPERNTRQTDGKTTAQNARHIVFVGGGVPSPVARVVLGASITTAAPQHSPFTRFVFHFLHGFINCFGIQ